MKQFTKQAENMGGILRIWAIPPGDISISGNIATIVSDTNIVNLCPTEGSGSFTEESIAGGAYKIGVEATVPGDGPENLAIIGELNRRGKYLVVLLDGNGKYRLAGTNTVPLRFSSKRLTGSGAASLCHFAVSFVAKASKQQSIFIGCPFA